MRVRLDMSIPENPTLRVRWRTSDALRELYAWFSPWWRPRWRLVSLALPVIPFPAVLREAIATGVTLHPPQPCQHPQVDRLERTVHGDENPRWTTNCVDCHARLCGFELDGASDGAYRYCRMSPDHAGGCSAWSGGRVDVPAALVEIRSTVTADEFAQAVSEADELRKCIRCRMLYPFGHLEYNSGVCGRCIARAGG